MSSQDSNSEATREDDLAQGAEHENDALASKLSKELSNWRKRRTNGRPRRNEPQNSSFQSDSARTIKLRGHETLVIRKPKLAKSAKPAPSNERPNP